MLLRGGVRGALGALALGLALPAEAQAPNIVEVAGGRLHTCALDDTGQVWCWGANWLGQVGDGTTDGPRLTLVRVQGMDDAIAIGTGEVFSCALRSSGTVACWGNNRFGQLGDGTFINRPSPVSVQGLTDVTAIGFGTAHACAVRSTGHLACWGHNASGQLGDGRLGPTNRNTPVAVEGIANAIAVDGGWQHSCALRRNGRIACWGLNGWGSLGDGTTDARLTPVRVHRVANATGIAVGWQHSCALRSNGRVACWGWNSSGRLGDGTSTSRSTAVRVHRVANATFIAAGDNHSCALRANGSVACWGINEGRLGDGTIDIRRTPVRVRRISDATAIATGGGHSCAVRSSGRVSCWGSNSRGQLGDGTTRRRRLTPVDVVFPH